MKHVISYIFLCLAVIVTVSALFSCARCDHQWGKEWKIDLLPTENDFGECSRTCYECGALDTYSLPDIRQTQAYESIEVMTSSTCSALGHGLYKYKFPIGDIYIEFEAPLKRLSHRFEGSVSISKDLHLNTCADCGQSIEYYHDFEKIYSSYATCQSEGTNEHNRCKSCGYCTEDKVVYPTVDCVYEDGRCRWCGEPKTFKLTYVDGEQREETKINQGDTFPAPQKESQMGVRYFLGWYLEDGEKLEKGAEINKDTVVNAKWADSVAVGTKEEFLAALNNPDGYYHLTNDINLNGEVLGKAKNFNGVFTGRKQDGSAYTVRNFYIHIEDSVTNGGIFSTNKGVISSINFKDVTVMGSNVTCNDKGALGAIVGKNAGTVENVTLTDLVFAVSVKQVNKDVSYYFGALSGLNEGKIISSGVNGTVNLVLDMTSDINNATPLFTCHYYFGGIAGCNIGDVEDTTARVDVEISTHLRTGSNDKAHMYIRVGGAIGENCGTVLRSEAIGEFRTENNTYMSQSAENTYIGGFVGVNSAVIRDSSSGGSVTGNGKNSGFLGGFVGENTGSGSIYSSYSTASVDVTAQPQSSLAAGGFAGSNSALIQTCYSSGEVNVVVNAFSGGFIGRNALGGTVSRCISVSSVVANAGYSNVFAGVNEGAVLKSYYDEAVRYHMGYSTSGSLSLTTFVTAVTFETLVSEEIICGALEWHIDGWTIADGALPTQSYKQSS